MLDLKIIRTNPDLIKDIIEKRNLKIDLDIFLELDKKLIKSKQELDELREVKNKVSKEIPSLKNEEKMLKIAEMKKLGEQIKTLENNLKIDTEKHTEIYYTIPNLLDPTAAIGNDEEENKPEEFFKKPTKFDFEPKPHYEIGEKKGWIDTKKGAEISGSRFWYLKGDLVLLQFAIINYAMAKLVSEGFSPIIPPFLVKEPAMFGTGFFPAEKNEIYRVNPDEDDLYLIGTSEVPITSYHSGDTLDLKNPIKYTGYSTCFRREAGTYGKDTKGILRGHQFDKIEMVVFCKQEDSTQMHNFMVAIEESIWQGLEIPYQKVNVCSGDLGNPAMKKYDLEAWMPGQERYREVTSCSNIGEYQSRRLGIKYKDENGKSKYAHTLNGTVIALSRCLMAIMENHQTKDGNIKIPEALIPFMGGKKEI